MNKLEQCIERCPLVARLPDEERTRILGEQALHLCPEVLLQGQIGLLCGLPPGAAKDLATRDAITTSKQLELSTV